MRCARTVLLFAVLAQALPGCSGVGASGSASIRAASTSPDWWNGAVVYEIFVRSFRDSNGDGTGDLAGVTAEIPYLRSLGVDAIWLMPIFPSPSQHGYDVTSYGDVNPTYDPNWVAGGSNPHSDFDVLLAAAHLAGLKVLLDYVPNHTSSQHPWFAEAVLGPSAPHRDFYVWSTTDPGWPEPWGGGRSWYEWGGAGDWYYAAFSSAMPDLNWRNPLVGQELAARAVDWLNRGVDGFRLDAVRYLVENGPGPGQQDQPETHADLRAFTATVRAASPQAIVLGEAWADASTIVPYFGSAESQSAGGDEVLPLDFPLAFAVQADVASDTSTGIPAALDAVAGQDPVGAGDAPFLANHDMDRIATLVGGDPGRLRVAAAILLTLQGTPIIYYGEELGMANGSAGCSGDDCKREPMAWDATPTHGFTGGTPWMAFAPNAPTANVATESADPGSLLARYQALIAVRKASPALRQGGTTRLDTPSPVLAYLRTSGTETVLVAHNLGAGPATRKVLVPGTLAEALFADPGAQATPAGAGTFTVSLPGHSSGAWRLR